MKLTSPELTNQDTTGSRVIVRPANVDDLDDLVTILWSVAAEGRWIGTEVPFDRQDRRRSLAKRLAAEDASILVAAVGPQDRAAVDSENAATVGSWDTAAAPGPPADRQQVVGNITVDVAPYGVAQVGMVLLDGWRGRGIGSALLDAGIAWTRTTDAHKMSLEVWPHNTAALALYRRAGFVEEGRRRLHYRRIGGELWDSILMGRTLP